LGEGSATGNQLVASGINLVVKELLVKLGETDDKRMEGLITRYEDLKNESYFDASLPTTSSKQATANLLTLCGLHFDPVFDIEKFKMESKN
jgi:hypothetical protein